MLLQSVYNGPIQYFARIVKEKTIVIEQHDHYIKQTYRNRCRILGANGPLTLSIPVVNVSGQNTLMKDTRIEYAFPWQKMHFKSIESAYASAPFYEFIIDDLSVFYTKRFEFLVDYNRQILETILNILDMDRKITHSDTFETITDEVNDPRFFIHPKKDFRIFDRQFRPVGYKQVFSEKHGFVPNLSILDLIFNEGIHSRQILEQSLES